MNIQFKPLEEKDINDLIEPMTKAFDNDAELYDSMEKGGPPGYNDGSFLYKWAIKDKSSKSYKIVVEDKSAGAFIVWWKKDGVSILGNIFLAPEYHNKKDSGYCL